MLWLFGNFPISWGFPYYFFSVRTFYKVIENLKKTQWNRSSGSEVMAWPREIAIHFYVYRLSFFFVLYVRQRLLKEAVEISKNNNFNRDDGLKLNHIWTSALRQDGALSLVRSKQAAQTNENAPRMEEWQHVYKWA